MQLRDIDVGVEVNKNKLDENLSDTVDEESEQLKIYKKQVWTVHISYNSQKMCK